jgi:hypothetical protein
MLVVHVLVLHIVFVFVLVPRSVQMRMLVGMLVVFVLVVRMLVDGSVGMPVFVVLTHAVDFDSPKCRPTPLSR